MACRWPPESLATGTSTEGISTSISSRYRRAAARIDRFPSSREPAAATCFFPVEKEVVVNTQLVYQRQVLEHRLYAVLACVLDGAEPDLLAVHEDPAAVRRVQPRQDLDKGGLAGAIVADQAERLRRVVGACPRPAGRLRDRRSS